MSERRPSFVFRFAGLFTLALLALMSLAYAFVVPRPTPRAPGAGPVPADTDDPRWAKAAAWVKAHPDTAVAVCEWPVDLPRGGRIDLGEAPAFWDDGKLIQPVPVAARGGLVRAEDGAARAWVGWADGRCTVWRPQTVRVQGVVEDQAGTPIAPATITGCGAVAEAGEDGTFEVVLQRDALEVATAAKDGRPRCALTAGKAKTPIALDQGGVQRIVVQ